MNYLVRAEQILYIEALIEADNVDEAAEIFLAEDGAAGRITSRSEPEVIEILEAP